MVSCSSVRCVILKQPFGLKKTHAIAMNTNTAAVSDTVATSSGHAQLEESLSVLDIPLLVTALQAL